jgi:hypothetical protein
MKTTDSPDVVIAKRLLDHAKRGGFTFLRVASGVDVRWWDTGSAMTTQT